MVDKWIISKPNKVHKCHQNAKCIEVPMHHHRYALQCILTDQNEIAVQNQWHWLKLQEQTHFSQSSVFWLKPGQKTKTEKIMVFEEG
jgi:hypothetical protein